MLDAIKPGENGWLFEKDDKNELIAALVDALGNLENLRSMGEAARKHVETHHAPEVQYGNTMTVYREALGRRGKLVI